MIYKILIIKYLYIKQIYGEFLASNIIFFEFELKQNQQNIINSLNMKKLNRCEIIFLTFFLLGCTMYIV